MDLKARLHIWFGVHKPFKISWELRYITQFTASSVIIFHHSYYYSYCDYFVLIAPSVLVFWIFLTYRECPLDLKEAISSLCFAAPRCADLPELIQVQMAFAGKYGKEFVAAATELMPECGVNRQVFKCHLI